MIESSLDADLSLASLAKESGYSRAHLLRMFHAATGLTPHRYVVTLRSVAPRNVCCKGIESLTSLRRVVSPASLI